MATKSISPKHLLDRTGRRLRATYFVVLTDTGSLPGKVSSSASPSFSSSRYGWLPGKAASKGGLSVSSSSERRRKRRRSAACRIVAKARNAKPALIRSTGKRVSTYFVGKAPSLQRRRAYRIAGAGEFLGEARWIEAGLEFGQRAVQPSAARLDVVLQLIERFAHPLMRSVMRATFCRTCCSGRIGSSPEGDALLRPHRAKLIAMAANTPPMTKAESASE